MGDRQEWVGDGETGDCDGHGTHVASLIAGQGGVGGAPDAEIRSLRVLDCNGMGTQSRVLKALSYVGEMAPKGSIVNMSLSGGYSPAINRAVETLVNNGFLVVAAAGNRAENACASSPGGAKAALTVGALTREDKGAYFSSYGPCVLLRRERGLLWG